MCGVTKLDKIRNERILIRGTTKVGEIAKKVQERRLRWYGNVMRREEQVLRRKEGNGNESTGKRGGPKRFRRWLDKVKDDIKEKGLAADEVYDRATSWAGECHRTSRRAARRGQDGRLTTLNFRTGSDHPECLPCFFFFYEVIFPVNKQGSIESPQLLLV